VLEKSDVLFCPSALRAQAYASFPFLGKFMSCRKIPEPRSMYLIETNLIFNDEKVHKFNNTALNYGIYIKAITKEINLGSKIKIQEHQRIDVPNNSLIEVDFILLFLTPIGNRAQASEPGGLQEK